MRAFILGLILLMAGAPAYACGIDTDCALEGRSYRVALPDGVEAPGALIYAHGFRGSSRGAMRNKALVAFAHANGLALVALSSRGDDWRIPGVPIDPGADGNEEQAYLDALLPALAERHGIDTARLVMTGFSAGGMFTWYLACHRGDRFQAFVPIAGTFWDPMPEVCPTYPVDLVHVHGSADKIVPLGGRPIRTTHQGDVMSAVLTLVEAAGFETEPGHVIEQHGDLSCRITPTASERSVTTCMHDGGHSFRISYLQTAFKILRDRGVLAAP